MCRNSITTKSYNFLKKYCHGRETCSIDATSDKFGGDCHGAKYLDITYSCEKNIS